MCRKLNREIKHNNTFYICKCDCRNVVSVSSSNLKSGHTSSCGCYHREKTSQIARKYHKKYNKYEFKDEYGICYLDDTNKSTIFDIEDYALIKDILWKTDNNGYARGYDIKTRRYIRMHKIITNTNADVIVDHINRDKLDNRKENFRYATSSENRINSKTRINNTSGIKGVRFEGGKWRARISHNKKYIHLGIYNDFDNAVRERLKAEKKFYGDFAMQKILFNKYNIK